MSRFDDEWRAMERRGAVIRSLAFAQMVATWLLTGLLTTVGIYALFNPEAIGAFAGHIVAGFNAAR